MRHWRHRMQFDQLKRREFIALLGGVMAASPLAASAQQTERVRRIGVLMGYPENDLEGPAFFASFREGLEKLGWVEGRNIRLDQQACPRSRRVLEGKRTKRRNGTLAPQKAVGCKQARIHTH